MFDDNMIGGDGLFGGLNAVLDGLAVTVPVLVPQLTCLLAEGVDPILPDEGLNNLLDDVGDALA